jgi:4-amino-4-deoxy-L-arabinose transferase-like glycosyltransferase
MAVMLRCVSALLQGDAVTALPGIQDQVSYDTLARRVLAGDGFTFPIEWWPATAAGAPTAHWSFLYTLYLTAVYAIFGPHPLAARLIQASIAGVLYPWLTWRLGRRLFGPQVGLISAGLTAGYGYFVYYAGALMTETFYILTILWALDLAARLVSTRRLVPGRTDWLGWLLLGVALGLAVLLRQVVLLFVPVLVGWLAWMVFRRSGPGLGHWRPLLSGVLLTGCVLVAMIAPWTIRNYQAFGRLVLLNTNAGYAFFWANHPIHGTNFVAIFPSQVYHDLIPPELRGLDEAALDSALMSRGIQFVVADPFRYAQLSLSRIKDYFEFLPSTASGEASNLARLLSFGVYLPLMVYGVAVSLMRGDRWVRGGRQAELWLVYLFGLVYSLIHLLSWALIRYRLPLDAILMPVAGLGLFELVERLRGGLATGLAQSAPVPAGAAVPNQPSPAASAPAVPLGGHEAQ